MAYRNTFFRWLFLYSLTFGLTYVLKLFTYLCPETGQKPGSQPRAGSIYAILKIRSVNVSGPKEKNIANGGSAACNPKFDNFGP